jgi:tetratricopeptide (TPR) repeat protein
MPLNRGQPYLMVGERVTIDVVVRNLGVGHTFPGGTNDSNEGWLEFTVVDDQGRVLTTSGFLQDDRRLDPLAHVYKSVMLDGNGNPIQKRNAQDAQVVVFANVIGPGTADVAHYEFEVPPQLAGSEITVRARLLWRKFNRDYAEFAFESNRAGFRMFEDVPDLPVTEIAADTVTFTVARDVPSESDSPMTDRADWIRFNDYGIGLFLEGNTRGAVVAFDAVSRAAPDRIDGPLNLARTAIADGDLESAYSYLRRSEDLAPGDARAAWVWGAVLQEDGRYEEAALAYRRVLEVFPEDRAAWRSLGRTLYLDRDYQDAIESFDRVLELDPEDRVSHYHKMLCYKAVGREAEARVSEAAYEYYSVDETAQALTQTYRLENPGVNLMTQRIRTHQLILSASPSWLP